MKSMVSSLREGLAEHVTALTMAHGKSDKKLDQLASSAMQEKMLAQKAKVRERDGKMEQQLEQLRRNREGMRMGSRERGAIGGPPPQAAVRLAVARGGRLVE